MAEAMFKQALNEREWSNTVVSSVGLGALVGKPPADHVCTLLSARGIDVTNHKARQLDGESVRNADLILVMEHYQKKAIEKQHPIAKGKVFLLGHWEGFEIPDPYQKDLRVFVETLMLIETGIKNWLQRF